MEEEGEGGGGGGRGVEGEKVEGIYILHELAAHWADLFAQGSTEHHDLLLMGGHAKNFLDIPTHVELFKHLVTFVQDKVFNVFEVQALISGQG